MSPYMAMFGSRVREELQYRAAALAGLFTQLVFGFIVLMVLLSFYASSERPAPMSAAQTLVYVWLAQAMLGLLPWNVDPAARDAIRTGAVVQELLRPIELYWLWFWRVLAWRVTRTTLRFLPLVVLAMFVFPRIGLAAYTLPAPRSALALLQFGLALILSALLSAACTVAIQVAMMWTTSPDGVLRLMPSFVTLLSGTLMPLPLFPDVLQPFLARQPLRGLVDTPTRIYGGDLMGADAWAALGWSALWVVVLIVLGDAATRRGVRKLVVAGG